MSDWTLNPLFWAGGLSDGCVFYLYNGEALAQIRPGDCESSPGLYILQEDMT